MGTFFLGHPVYTDLKRNERELLYKPTLKAFPEGCQAKCMECTNFSTDQDRFKG